VRSNGILWGTGGGGGPSEKFRLVKRPNIWVAADCDSKWPVTRRIVVNLWSG